MTGTAKGTMQNLLRNLGGSGDSLGAGVGALRTHPTLDVS